MLFLIGLIWYERGLLSILFMIDEFMGEKLPWLVP